MESKKKKVNLTELLPKSIKTFLGRKEEKLQAKRLGKTLPEETIRVPKIGEWKLSQTTTIPANRKTKQKSMFFM